MISGTAIRYEKKILSSYVSRVWNIDTSSFESTAKSQNQSQVCFVSKASLAAGEGLSLQTIMAPRSQQHQQTHSTNQYISLSIIMFSPSSLTSMPKYLVLLCPSSPSFFPLATPIPFLEELYCMILAHVGRDRYCSDPVIAL